MDLDYSLLAKMTDGELEKLFGIRDFFVYEIDVAALAAAGTASPSFTVQSDANFLWTHGAMFADVDGDAQEDSTRVLPLVSCTIQDQGSGRQLMSANVPVPSLFGTAGKIFELPTPRFFRSNTQVTLALLNFSDETTYNLKLQFIGAKFFKYAQGI